jgi:hypothetical protein
MAKNQASDKKGTFENLKNFYKVVIMIRLTKGREVLLSFG